MSHAARAPEPSGAGLTADAHPVGEGLVASPRGRPLWWQLVVLLLALALTLAALLGVTAIALRPHGAAATASPTPTPPSFLLANPRPAPALRLTGADGLPFDLASLRGEGVLVFFGYTHCPDVCPATTGILSQVLGRYGRGLRAVFVSVDPERDTVAWLAEYQKYLSPGFSAVTGTPAQVRTTADAWGVKYARVDGDDPGTYSMSHTASVYLVDRQGTLRADFPFGTQVDAMSRTVAEVIGPPSPPGTPTAAPSAQPTAPSPATATPGATAPASAPPASPTAIPPAGELRVEITSSSVWARGSSPLIVALYDGTARINDEGAHVTLQLVDQTGTPSGLPAPASVVRPPGVAAASYVATLDIPTPGSWKVVATYEAGGVVRTGSIGVSALDPGDTAPLGGRAPTLRTPTLDDVGGDATAVTTDPAPDLRLYRTSTTDALAAGRAFVLVIDSRQFKTSPACGQAIALARFLLDRWPGTPIIHLEPFAYDVVSDTPVLRGSLADPTVVPAAVAWGIGPAPWTATSMPWMFVVDAAGVVRAKYQGVIGSADIDVLLALLQG